MEHKELRQALATHLDTLKRNLAAVPLEVLKTQYKKPFDKLKQDICATASAYVKAVILEDIQIRPDYVEEAGKIMNDVIQQSGLLKQIAKAAFKKQDIDEIDSLALELKSRIQEALQPFYYKHLGLYLSPECFDEPPKEPEIYCDVTGCVLRDNVWVPLETSGNKLLVSLKEKKESAA